MANKVHNSIHALADASMGQKWVLRGENEIEAIDGKQSPVHLARVMRVARDIFRRYTLIDATIRRNALDNLLRAYVEMKPNIEEWVTWAAINAFGLFGTDAPEVMFLELSKELEKLLPLEEQAMRRSLRKAKVAPGQNRTQSLHTYANRLKNKVIIQKLNNSKGESRSQWTRPVFQHEFNELFEAAVAYALSWLDDHQKDLKDAKQLVPGSEEAQEVRDVVRFVADLYNKARGENGTIIRHGKPEPEMAFETASLATHSLYHRQGALQNNWRELYNLVAERFLPFINFDEMANLINDNYEVMYDFCVMRAPEPGDTEYLKEYNAKHLEYRDTCIDEVLQVMIDTRKDLDPTNFEPFNIFDTNLKCTLAHRFANSQEERPQAQEEESQAQGDSSRGGLLEEIRKGKALKKAPEPQPASSSQGGIGAILARSTKFQSVMNANHSDEE